MKGKEKTIILIALILLCIAFVVVLVVKKADTKKDDEKKEEFVASKSESYDSTTLPDDDDVAKELMERIQDYDFLDSLELRGHMMDNNYVLQYAIFVLNYDFNTPIKGEEVESVAKKYFDVDFKHGDIMSTNGMNILYKYDSATNMYNPYIETNEDGHIENHAEIFQIPYNTLERFGEHTVDGEYHTITVYKAFTEMYAETSVPNRYYSAFSGGKVLFDIEYDLTKPTNVFQEFRKLSNDELTKATYTFVKRDGIFMLVSYESQRP